jgi:prolipoprotein diacylglyceryltransferase
MSLHIPSPPSAGIHLRPAYIHAYGLMYVIGITLAIWITADQGLDVGRSDVADRALS